MQKCRVKTFIKSFPGNETESRLGELSLLLADASYAAVRLKNQEIEILRCQRKLAQVEAATVS